MLSNPHRNNAIKLATFGCIALLLTLNFYTNVFRSAKAEWFNTFQLDSESLTVARLARTQEEGMWSDGGLQGRFYGKTYPDSLNENTYQYHRYYHGPDSAKVKYSTYKTEIGGQAMMFAVLDDITPFTNARSYEFFRLVASFLSALAFTVFLYWVLQSFGAFTCCLLLLLILYSGWITVFGRNIFWGLWSFYVPFLTISLWLHRHSSKPNNGTGPGFYLAVYAAVWVKSFITGYEYISTAMIMLTVPLLYYAINHNWSLRQFVFTFMKTSVVSLLAVFSSMAVLVYQISKVSGSLQAGIDHIFFSYDKRSFGELENYKHPVLEASLKADPLDVVRTYFDGTAMRLTNLLGVDVGTITLKFNAFIIAFAAASVLALVIVKGQQKQTAKALVVATWFSIMAPLSWFVLFKGHSQIHTHMNYITWYMPFALLGFCLVGFALQQTTHRAWQHWLQR